MSTTLHRISVTETAQVAGWIDEAGHEYPEVADNRSAALRRLIELGARAIAEQRDARADRRRALIATSAGWATGSYPPDARESLRDEWPE